MKYDTSWRAITVHVLFIKKETLAAREAGKSCTNCCIIRLLQIMLQFFSLLFWEKAIYFFMLGLVLVFFLIDILVFIFFLRPSSQELYYRIWFRNSTWTRIRIGNPDQIWECWNCHKKGKVKKIFVWKTLFWTGGFVSLNALYVDLHDGFWFF